MAIIFKGRIKLVKSGVSIWIATWNNVNLLGNTLYSLSLQKTDFPFEICVVDDCSTESPEPIVRKYFPKAKFLRLPNHVGFNFAQSYCFDLANENLDVVLMQTADVIYTTKNIVNDLCHGVGEKIISLPEVVDIPTPENMTPTEFTERIDHCLNDWDRFIRYRNADIDGVIFNIHTKYSGENCSWLFFSGAIRRDDFEDMGYDANENICDGILQYNLRICNFRANIMPNLKIIHQRHKKTAYPCNVMESCSIDCLRKNRKYIAGVKAIHNRGTIT